MGFTDFLKTNTNSELKYREAQKVAKDICLKNTFFLDTHFIDYLACDLNGLAFLTISDDNSEDTRAIYDELFQGLHTMGYPCCNSIRYGISRKNKQFDDAEKYLEAAVANNEPAADYLNAYHHLANGKPNPDALKELKRIANTNSHPCHKLAEELIESIEKKSNKGCSSTVVKVIKIGIKALLLLGLISSIFKGYFSDIWLFLGIYLVLKVISFVGGIIISFFSPADITSETFYSLSDVKFKHSLDIFNSNIKYPRICETPAGHLLPCNSPLFENNSYSNDYEYEEIIYDNEGRSIGTRTRIGSVVDKERMKHDFSIVVTNIIGQISIYRKAKKEVFMDACKQGDKASKAALEIFFGLTYKDGEFVEYEGSIYAAALAECKHLAKYLD